MTTKHKMLLGYGILLEGETVEDAVRCYTRFGGLFPTKKSAQENVNALRVLKISAEVTVYVPKTKRRSK